MAGKGRPTLADELMSSLSHKLHWLQRLPPDAVNELDEVRKLFRAGKLIAKPYLLASSIIAHRKDSGWDLPSEKVLAKWLKADD